MGKYSKVKPCDCGWSFTTLQKQRCEPPAWTLLDMHYFTLQILCSHVTALRYLFHLVFLCNSISFILSYFSAGPCPACLRPNSNNSLTIWTRQPCNTTNTFLSYQHYYSSFNEKSINSFSLLLGLIVHATSACQVWFVLLVTMLRAKWPTGGPA